MKNMERWVGTLAAVVVALPLTVGAARSDAAEGAPADSGYTIKGGQDRTDLRTLTVEGEDRVHVVVERPGLTLALDPTQVQGLVSGDARDILDRVPPDLTTAYLAGSAQEQTPYTGRPWLGHFASGAVARFHPDVKGTDRWRLVVADSRGTTVTSFEGKGTPPKEIVWDGKSTAGAFVTPGVTYSYVFEAKDKAGNKRNFVGEGFRISAYRLDGPEGPTLAFSGLELLPSGSATSPYGSSGASRATPTILLEAASWLNQSPNVTRVVRVTATGRSAEQARALANQVTTALAIHTIGDPARIQAVPTVATDAPDGGTVHITLAATTLVPAKTLGTAGTATTGATTAKNATKKSNARSSK
jgi:hypothetical protein